MTRTSLSILVLACAVGCSEPEPAPSDPPVAESAPAARPEAGLEAFETVYAVLTHPRCMNCHPLGDRPLQFDDSRPHAMNVQRGADGRGLPGMRCTTCHQRANHELAHLPPGNPEWRLAPVEQAFEGKTPRELIAHVRDDALVGWGWDPGPGREPVGVAREDFVEAFQAWIDAGTPLPGEGR